jgi:hypothetical protein
VGNRIKQEVLSREVTSSKTVKTVYKAGYATVTVNSRFNGCDALEDLLFELLKLKLRDRNEQEDTAILPECG